MQKDKREKYSKLILLIGTILMVAAPFLFMSIYGIRLSDTAEIGETIGGITSPIAALVGAILIYYALSAQIDSNKLIADQIEKDNIKERKQNEESHISQLYDFFSKNIEDYSFEQINDKGEIITIFRGSVALHYFVQFIQNQKEIDSHNTEALLHNRNVREFVSIIESSKLLIESLKESIIDAEDKVYYKNLIEHQLTYKISPNFDSISEYGIKQETCSVHGCDIEHGTFPVFILEMLLETKQKLNLV